MFYRISSAMASFCKSQGLEGAMRLVKDAGFDSLDFPFSAYSSAPDAPLNGENWREWVREVRRISERLALPITQAHATWQQAIPADFHYEPPQEVYFRTMEACQTVGCRNLIFHPLRQSERVDSPAMRRRIHDWNIRWFHDLLPAAEQYGIVINLENTFDSHHVQQPGDLPYPYTTAQDMLDLMHDIGSMRVQLCLDTGHANISGQDIPSMIRAFRSDLATVHLNDNYGYITPVYEDLHLFPGYGRIAWEPIFAALREVNFKGVLNIEPIGDLKHLPREVCLIQLRAAAETLSLLSGDDSKKR